MLTQERLKEVLSYDADTGIFTRLVTANSNAKAGSIAGNIGSNGHLRISVDNKSYPASHLAWLYQTGELPKGKIDFRDGDKTNISFSNLRETLSHSGELTQARLKELLSYDPETGVFTRRVASGTAKVGDCAGCIDGSNGYIVICIDNERYVAHRLACLYMTGSFPARDVDHANLNRSDNRWDNLRDATESQNGANKRVSKRSKLGIKGVSPTKHGTFRATICVNDNREYLGSFTTAELASAAYAAAAKKYFGEFARAGFAANDNHESVARAA